MKTNYLIPHKYKPLGWLLFSLGLISGILIFIKGYETDFLQVKVLSIYNDDTMFAESKGFIKIIENSIADELAALAIIIGGLLLGFSKERVEDEFIYKLRKDSLVWAMILNYIILIIAIILVYNLTFFDVLVFNMFTPLVFFVLRFNFLKYKLSRHEE